MFTVTFVLLPFVQDKCHQISLPPAVGDRAQYAHQGWISTGVGRDRWRGSRGDRAHTGGVGPEPPSLKSAVKYRIRGA